jgi:hypothetical protein
MEHIIDVPGFQTLIYNDKEENHIVIEVDNIVNVEYIRILHTYIDSFLRITQHPNTTEVAKKYPAALKFLSRFKNTMAGKAIESQREPGMIEPYAGLVVAVNALVFVNVGGLVNAAIATNAAVYVKVEVELAVHQHQAIATTTSVMTAGE